VSYLYVDKMVEKFHDTYIASSWLLAETRKEPFFQDASITSNVLKNVIIPLRDELNAIEDPMCLPTWKVEVVPAERSSNDISFIRLNLTFEHAPDSNLLWYIYILIYENGEVKVGSYARYSNLYSVIQSIVNMDLFSTDIQVREAAWNLLRRYIKEIHEESKKEVV